VRAARGSSPTVPHTVRKVFVEYNRTSAVKIVVVLLVNYFQTQICICEKYSPKIGHGSVTPLVDRQL